VLRKRLNSPEEGLGTVAGKVAASQGKPGWGSWALPSRQEQLSWLRTAFRRDEGSLSGLQKTLFQTEGS